MIGRKFFIVDNGLQSVKTQMTRVKPSYKSNGIQTEETQ